VALGIGRVVPELAGKGVTWPYTAVGAGFALYGVAMIVYGSLRVRAVEAALGRGEFAWPSDRFLAAMTVAGALLGLAAVVLILVD
jgi:hypothetical protein